MGSLFLLQGIFPTQGSNSGLLNYRQIRYQLSHKGSPEGGIFNWEMTVFSLDTNFPAIATVFHSHFKYTGQESLSTDRCVELRELVLWAPPCLFLFWEVNVVSWGLPCAVGFWLGLLSSLKPPPSLILCFSPCLCFPLYTCDIQSGSPATLQPQQDSAQECVQLRRVGRDSAVALRVIRWTQETFQWETNTASGRTHRGGKTGETGLSYQVETRGPFCLLFGHLLLNTLRWTSLLLQCDLGVSFQRTYTLRCQKVTEGICDVFASTFWAQHRTPQLGQSWRSLHPWPPKEWDDANCCNRDGPRDYPAKRSTWNRKIASDVAYM